MPLQVTRPAIPEDQVARNLGSKAKTFVEDCADLAKWSLQSYTPNRWKQLLYGAVSTTGDIPGGKGVGGPLGRGGKLPDPTAAPRGTIAEFLHRHPEFLPQNRLRGGQEVGRGRRIYVAKGRSFPKAWWHLPTEAKAMLRDERKQGMYRSGAPAAPYWLIAEEGMTYTGVPARYYLRNSRAAVNRAVPMVEARTIGTL
jgi:hypothetical protein